MSDFSVSQEDDIRIITFGCRLNAYESEVMRTLAHQAGMTNTVIINTCTVTSEAERQARQTIRRVHRDYPTATIIVTGCAAQLAPETYAAMPEVDRVIDNTAKQRAETFVSQHTSTHTFPQSFLPASDRTTEHSVTYRPTSFEGHTRALVQIQQGCDHRCTFCVIPYARGPAYSIPVSDLVEHVGTLTQKGYQEIVLTGVDITSYGLDLDGQPTLGQLVYQILSNVPTLARLRLSSLDPSEIDEQLWSVIGTESRLMPHLHLSIQAGDDLILKRMKRRHCRADVIKVCHRARSLRPDIVFGADFIVGFPTETEQHFTHTLDLVAECDLTWLHVFSYSSRPHTPAQKMPQVPITVRKQRSEQLRKVGKHALQRFLHTQRGRHTQILVEKETFGRTEHHVPLHLVSRFDAQGVPIIPGRLIRAEVIDVGHDHLYGRVIGSQTPSN